MYVYVYVYVYVCFYVCIHMYVHTRVGVHMHTKFVTWWYVLSQKLCIQYILENVYIFMNKYTYHENALVVEVDKNLVVQFLKTKTDICIIAKYVYTIYLDKREYMYKWIYILW